MTYGNTLPPTPSEPARSHETLGRVPRVVIFGTRTDGSAEIDAYLAEATQAISDASVEVISSAQHMEDGFYGRIGTPEILKDNPLIAAGRVLLQEIGVSVASHRTTINPTRTEGPDTLPQGVVILPSMRQRNLIAGGGSGMSIPTPVDKIIGLCEQHKVPFVRMDAPPSPERIR